MKLILYILYTYTYLSNNHYNVYYWGLMTPNLFQSNCWFHKTLRNLHWFQCLNEPVMTEKHLDSLTLSANFLIKISPQIVIISFWIRGFKYLLLVSDSRWDFKNSQSFALYFKIARKLPSLWVESKSKQKILIIVLFYFDKIINLLLKFIGPKLKLLLKGISR